MRSRKDLAEVRHPQAQNSVAALQLFNALPSSLALSVNKVVGAVHPPAEMSVLASRSTRSFAEELPIKLQDEMPLVRALGLEQRVLARPACRREGLLSLRGRPTARLPAGGAGAPR